MKIKRGDIWWVDFCPARGSEQAGLRPAVVIQNDTGNKYSNTTIVAALSTQIQAYPQNVILDPNTINNLPQKSCVKGGQILTIDQDRCTQKIGHCTAQELQEIDGALGLSLGLR